MIITYSYDPRLTEIHYCSRCTICKP